MSQACHSTEETISNHRTHGHTRPCVPIGASITTWPKQPLTLVLSCALVLALWQGCAITSATGPGELNAYQVAEASSPSATQPAPETLTQLQQLVAPIALYPDELVAQILAASTYPAQIVEADRWLQQHTNLKGDQLATAVDQQHWDPSVKALTQFPSVLANLDKNLSWTSELGDAYVNQQQDVLDAVQVMRKRAQDAGTFSPVTQSRTRTAGSSSSRNIRKCTGSPRNRMAR